jgi:release factor glutamine methyltransferase
MNRSPLSALVSYYAKFLTQNRITPRAEFEVRLLLRESLGINNWSHFYLQFPLSLSQEALSKFKKLIKRRLLGEPISYILGKKEFFSTEFRLREGVFIPRPESELLVEESVKWLKRKVNKVVLDVGTGSGNLIISIAKELPSSGYKFFASDISSQAVAVAASNAQRVGVKIQFFIGDLFEPIKENKFDLLVINPPYIPTPEIEKLADEVKNFEPHLALDGGKDGLKFIRRIITEAHFYLRAQGKVILEIGHGQSREVLKLIREVNKYTNIEIKRDFNNIPRVVLLEKHG